MDVYKKSAHNVAKAARAASRREQNAADIATRRDKAIPRGYGPSATTLAKRERLAAKDREAASQQKYVQDRDAYKRRESPMSAIATAIESGMVEGVRIGSAGKSRHG